MKRGRPLKHPQPNTTKIVFRRYGNRRLYSDGKYVTINELLVHSRRHVLVIDASTGQDITEYAFAAAKHEKEAARLLEWRKRLGL